MEKKTSAALKEWARTLLFLNYKTYVVAGEKKGDRPRGTGGHRVINASHHPAWDAKNRGGLPDESTMEYASIAGLFNYQAATPQPTVAVPQQPQPDPQPGDPIPFANMLEPLRELMQRDGVTEQELQLAVAKQKYYPADTPLANYDPQFVAGKLVAHWGGVLGVINQVRQEVAAI